MMAKTLCRVAVTEIATASTLSALAGLTGGFQALLMSQWGGCQFSPLCWLYVGRGCGQTSGPDARHHFKAYFVCLFVSMSRGFN